jgi:NADH-quinone oxidoreductase subunit J
MNPRPSTFALCCRELFMELAFYIAGAVAVAATVLMVTRMSVVHALLYLVVSLLGVAVVFYLLGAPFVAALEVIVYAGAIMVLFVFVVMMLNLAHSAETERQWLTPGIWIGPVILAGILLIEVLYLVRHTTTGLSTAPLGPREVAMSLFGPYLVGVELASMLLLAGLVGAYHLGLRQTEIPEIQHDANTHERRVAASGDIVLAWTHQPSRTP